MYRITTAISWRHEAIMKNLNHAINHVYDAQMR